MLLLVAAVLSLTVTATALAEPVQEFGFTIHDVRPDGRYAVTFSSNSYDTTGEPPPILVTNYVRFAAGISFRPEFLRRSVLCDAELLRDTLRELPEPGVYYGDQLRRLPATYRRLRPRLGGEQARNMRTCIAARSATGRVIADARPYVPDPVPADLYLFLSRPTEPGAFASFGVLAVMDRREPVIRDNPVLAAQRFIFFANLFDDPTPDGLYGVRLLLPPGKVGSLRFSVAELRVENPGMTRVVSERRCVLRRGGRCVRTTLARRTVWWATPPTCPPSGQIQFEATYVYETGLRATKLLRTPCPWFVR